MKNAVNLTLLKGFFLISLFFTGLSATAIDNATNRFQVNDVELTDLQEMLDNLQTYKFYNYTDGSWQTLVQAKIVAIQLINEQSGNISAIAASAQALEDATNGLIEKENLASGATGTANSFHSTGYEVKNALDENFSTRWASSSGTTFWYRIDLGSSRQFNQLAIFSTAMFPGRLSLISVSVSDDATLWTPWRERDKVDGYISIVGEAVTARYIKIDFSNCDNAGINVDEFMVFNDATAVESKELTPARPDDPSWIKQIPATTPNVYQLRKADLKYGAFLHYGLNTYAGEEWTDGSYPASTYHPNSKLDPDSWIKAAYEGGMNYVLIITKHHDGLAMWNTAVGTYNINHTGRESDKRDIVAEAAAACHKYGIKLGLYYSIWDRNWDRNHTTELTGLDQAALNQQYNDFALEHIKELMDGRYGEIAELWVDGSWEKKNEDWELARLYHTVKSLQPSCQIAVNWSVGGVGTDPAKLKGGEEMTFFPSEFRLADPMLTKPGADADPKVYKYQGQSYYLPFEATLSINRSWFWNAGHNASGVMAAAQIRSVYRQMVGQGNTFVLNLSPNTDGVLSTFDVSGLYAGARAAGIARGSARADIPADECAVEVRYVTNKGHIANPTRFLYGKKGEQYNALPLELGKIGYKLLTTPDNTTGTFDNKKIVVEFIYEDTGVSEETGINKPKVHSRNSAFVDGQKIILTCDEDSGVSICNITGSQIKQLNIKAQSTEIIDAANLSGVYIVKFTSGNNYTDIVKIVVQ